MNEHKNKELMLACGSKNGAYDIEAPDQWKWVLNHSKDADEAAMAWVKSKTTAFHHESPYCVDEHGNALYAQHLATDKGWSLQSARNVLCRLASQGRIRLKKGQQIWYCADIPQARGADSTNGTNYSVQSYWGTYVVDFIEKLSEEKRAQVEAKTEAFLVWRREFMTEGVAALRAIADRIEDTTLLEIGLPKKRLPKRREAEAKWVQLDILAQPEFVQSHFGDSVQNGKPDCAESENGPYKTETAALSLLCSATAATTPPSSSSVTLPIQSAESTTTPRMMGAEFHKKLAGQFRSARKPAPTHAQSKPIYDALAENCALFLEWLTPAKLQPVKHPGVLPKLLEEFTEGLDDFRVTQARFAAEQEKQEALQIERNTERERESAEAEVRRQHLIDCPEDCPRCKGAGRYDRNRKICNCPKGQQLLERD